MPGPSNQDSPAPIDRLRQLPLGTWKRSESAPRGNLDTKQSVPLNAAIARESVARTAAPAHSVVPKHQLPASEPVHPGPTGPAVMSRTAKSATKNKPNSACPIEP